jgi:multimeric flavodoxin WrbA
MKIVVILGSRNPQGQTARAANAFIEGAKQAGAEVESFYLPTMNIQRCKQCDENGWGGCRQRGACGGHQDDLALLADKMRQADGVVFATPVYWGSLSESMRTFTDRLRRITRHENGRLGIEGKKAVGICVAGGSGGGAPKCCVDLEYTLSVSGLNLVDLIPARRQNLPMKLGLLRQEGAWFARGASETEA